MDISFKEVKESKKYRSIYKIEGKLGKKILTLQYYSISEKEIKKIQELEKLFLEEQHGQSINNSPQDTIKKILSTMPKLLKEAKQKKMQKKENQMKEHLLKSFDTYLEKHSKSYMTHIHGWSPIYPH